VGDTLCTDSEKGFFTAGFLFFCRFLDAAADAKQVRVFYFIFFQSYFVKFKTCSPFQATQLDPFYSKGWARLASANDVGISIHPYLLKVVNIDSQALNGIGDAIDAWQKAIDTLPKDNLSPVEIKQKEQYQTGWKAAMARKQELENKRPPVITLKEYAGKAPWDKAKAMMPELERKGVAMAHSSVRTSILIVVLEYSDKICRPG
jgi:hypothetical protein